jgi:hypothetical protein
MTKHVQDEIKLPGLEVLCKIHTWYKVEIHNDINLKYLNLVKERTAGSPRKLTGLHKPENRYWNS